MYAKKSRPKAAHKGIGLTITAAVQPGLSVIGLDDRERRDRHRLDRAFLAALPLTDTQAVVFR